RREVEPREVRACRAVSRPASGQGPRVPAARSFRLEMTPALRNQVRQRTGDCCEYCRMPQQFTSLPHEADHIRSQKHNGPTVPENLCWACAQCNDFKGSDIAAHDPVTDGLAPLFNPRLDAWEDHFEWSGPLLVGRSAVGRATVELLRINLRERVEHRRLLSQAGLLPAE